MKTPWQTNNPNQYIDLSENLYSWMSYRGSFMDRLRELGEVNLTIKVLKEQWQKPYVEESQILGIKSSTWVREVVISNENNPLMYARTVIPQETLTEQYLPLTQLKNRALGSILFKDKNMQRGEFEMACLTKKNRWYKKAVLYDPTFPNLLWGRRSIFYLKDKKLLLTEIFFSQMGNF